MGPSSYMRSVVDRNVVMRRMTVLSPNFHGGTEINHDSQSWNHIRGRDRHSNATDPRPSTTPRSLARSDPRPVFATGTPVLYSPVLQLCRGSHKAAIQRITSNLVTFFGIISVT